MTYASDILWHMEMVFCLLGLIALLDLLASRPGPLQIYTEKGILSWLHKQALVRSTRAPLLEYAGVT